MGYTIILLLDEYKTMTDRKSVVEGKRVSHGLDAGGRAF